MSNQHYFDVPFAFSGDKTAIPDPLQTGGTVSFTEGWNYNYQRNLSTDPAAIPIDRSTMNWLFDQITTAIQQLQQTGTPEFILAAQNGGVAFPYGPQAEVLWSASGNAPFTRYININGGTNSNTPSASDPLGATTGWQVSCDPIATSAQAGAGTNNASIMTPLLVAQQTALRALLAGSATQVFNVGPATARTQAPEAGQIQDNSILYAVDSGAANAVVVSPGPTGMAAYADGQIVYAKIKAANTGATTLNVWALGATGVVGLAHAALQGGELIANGYAAFQFNSTLSRWVLLWCTGAAEQIANATQSQHAVTLGQQTSAIAAAVANYLPLTGGTVTGASSFTNGLTVSSLTSNGVILLPNNGALQAKTTGGVATSIAYIDASNIAHFGNSTLSTRIDGSAITTNAVPVAIGAATASGQAMSESQSFGSPLQAYSALAGSRAIGTTYTNSTGRPITMNVTASSTGSGQSVGIGISGLGVVNSSYISTGSGQGLSTTAVIPPGATYVVTAAGGTPTLSLWNEYR